jgi:valyl-tRNA synthetase
MASGRRLCVKLWNVAKLALGHLADYDPVAERAPERPIDAWVERRLGEVVDEATALLETFEFGLAKKRVEDFFWNDFCDNWLEMVKGRLYEPRSPAERRTAQHVLHTIVYAVLRLFSPFVPHVTEAIYQAGFRARLGTPSLTRTPWPESGPLYGALPRGAAAPGDAAVFGHPGFLAVAVLGLIRRWRSEQKVSPARPIPRVAVTLPPVGMAMFAAIADDVVAAGRVEAFDLVAGPSDLDGPRVEVTVPPPPVPPAPTA